MNEVKKERRSFLKHALAGTVAATALAATGGKSKAQNHPGEGGAEGTGKHPEILYRETEEFREYYKKLYS